MQLHPQFLAAVKACLPVLPGVLTFGAISGVVVPGLVLSAGSVHIGLDNPRLLAGILAGAIAWRTRNTLLTIVSGMLALHLFGYLLM